MNCVFSANYACAGGALSVVEASRPNIIDCEFIGNRADEDGGACCADHGAPTFTGCTFRGNHAYRGGAVLCSEGVAGDAVFTDCTFSANVAEWGSGGAISCYFVSPTIRSCTLYGNASITGAGGIYCSADAAPSVENTIIAFGVAGCAIFGNGVPILTCCDIFGNAGGDWIGMIEDQYGVSGNIAEDPLLCNPAEGDFRLREDSPCAPFSPPNPECDLIGAWSVGCWSDVDDPPLRGSVPSLCRATPNPFFALTRLTYWVRGADDVTGLHVAIYDLAGRRVRTLAGRPGVGGGRTATWDARDAQGIRVPAGIYLARLEHGSSSAVRTLIVVD